MFMTVLLDLFYRFALCCVDASDRSSMVSGLVLSGRCPAETSENNLKMWVEYRLNYIKSLHAACGDSSFVQKNVFLLKLI